MLGSMVSSHALTGSLPMKKRMEIVTGWNTQGMFQKIYINGELYDTIESVESINFTTEHTDGKTKVPGRDSNKRPLG